MLPGYNNVVGPRFGIVDTLRSCNHNCDSCLEWQPATKPDAVLHACAPHLMPLPASVIALVETLFLHTY